MEVDVYLEATFAIPGEINRDHNHTSKDYKEILVNKSQIKYRNKGR